MTVPTFSNTSSANKRLYIADNPADGAGWCACLLSAPAATATITLAQSWEIKNKAAYLFAPAAPTDTAKFVQDTDILLKSLSGFSNAFLWVANSNAVTKAYTSYVLVQQNTNLQRYTSNNSNILFGKYLNLSVPSGCLIQLSEKKLFFEVRNQIGSIIWFYNQVGVPQSQITNDRIYISVSGASSGCVRFGLRFNGASDWKSFDADPRLFYGASTSASTLKFPLLDAGCTALLTFQASLDPNDQLNNGAVPRTFLAFDTSAQVVLTYLRSSFGNVLSLAPYVSFLPDENPLPYAVPASGAAMLVFSASDKGNTSANYLLPKGGFHLIAGAPLAEPAVLNLLCGLSGLETVSFIPRTKTYAGDLLLFTDKQPAYVQGYPVVPSENGTQPTLTDSYLGGWVSVTAAAGRPARPPADAIRYVSQPTGASLYGVTSLTTQTATNFLGFYEPTTAPLQVAGTNLFFPMGIYGAFTSATTQSVDLVRFEKAVLSPIRKAILEKGALPHLIMDRQRQRVARQSGLAVGSAGDTPSTSPQGLLVTIDAAQAWTSLVLAKNAGQGSAASQTMAFYNLNAKLQSAFQTNQQFLVIGLNKLSGNGDILGDFQSEIKLEGWPFRIRVPKSTTNGQFNNVLIFKFCAGSLAERVADPALWTNATDVNDTTQNSLAELSSWLDAYVKDSVKKAREAGDPDFLHFADIVTNPSWNGILALKTDIGIENFPSELQGLLAGIDLAQFSAHHFGINANYILTKKDPTTGQVSITMDDKSSMFGLIYYVDAAFAPYTGNVPAYKQTLDFNPSSAFNFKTLMLKVLFENSKIKSFKSFVQLSIYQLFGSEVTETTNRDNILVLSGSYEDHNGLPSYSFTGSGRDMIPLANPAFKTVEVVRSSFSTLLSSATQQTDRMVYAQFALWGYLNFAALQGMDLLSFGSDNAPVSTEGLAYSQLLVRMSFSLDTPAVKTFAFDAGGITFDVSASRSRRASLFNHFPVKLTGLVSGNADQLPAKLDFIKVQTPTLTSAGDPAGDWYGLVYDLNLGTPGALASSAGFKSSLLLAWSVSEGTIYTGLKLPGMSSQSKLLSLQGVLGLDISSVKLLLASPQPGETATAYLLMLNKVALKFLSKKFPAGGNIDFYLFGDPNNQAQPGSMGWYAAYQKTAKKAIKAARTKKKQ